jgi:hypothetical protein
VIQQGKDNGYMKPLLRVIATVACVFSWLRLILDAFVLDPGVMREPVLSAGEREQCT